MHARATSLDLNLDVEFNPFADDTSSITEAGLDAQSRPGHSRARTEYLTGNDSAGHQHPLRSAGLAPHRPNGDITRPSLIRVLNSDTGSESDQSVSSSASAVTANPGNRIVLLHEVQRGESLAGLALKYGMALADLRRTNHLWANDSIHLRKTLYIPLDKSAKARLLVASDEPALVGEDTEEPGDEESISDRGSNGATSESILVSPPSTIRRVPASALSYFPPPSRKPSPNSIRPRPLHSRQVSASPTSTSSLSTIFSGADTIISRLSLDGVAPSSYSDRKRSFDQERSASHELSDVPMRPSLDGGLDRLQRDKRSGHGRSATAWDAWHTSSSKSRPSPLSPKQNGKGATTSSPLPPPRITQTVRTAQLEPQPAMQLPPRNSGSMKSTASSKTYKTYSSGDNHSTNGSAHHNGNGFSSRPTPKKSRPSLRDVQFETPRTTAEGIELG